MQFVQFILFSILAILSVGEFVSADFQPFIYSKLFDSIKPTNVNESTANNLIELAQNEDNLKLFIKLPVNNASTIVVLEGEYDS